MLYQCFKKIVKKEKDKYIIIDSKPIINPDPKPYHNLNRKVMLVFGFKVRFRTGIFAYYYLNLPFVWTPVGT